MGKKQAPAKQSDNQGQTHSHLDKEASDWLRLIRTPQIGPVSFWKFVNVFGDVSTAIERANEYAKARGQRPFKIVSLREAQKEQSQLHRQGGEFIIANSDDYSPYLKAIDTPPPVLAAIGDKSLLQKPTIAIVGARNASAAGKKITEELARELGQNGYVIASGLARGIDAAAHEASLTTGTIAVVAGGIDRIYPPEHKDLQAKICEQGLLLSEAPLGYPPQARDFPRRNRIVTGLSLAVIVVEAAKKSGTLISARLAGEQGREVMAVPGSPLDLRYGGSNTLIKNGARLVDSVDDVLEALETLPLLKPKEFAHYKDGLVEEDYIHEPALDQETKQNALSLILEALSPLPMPIEDIASSAGLPVKLVQSLIVELELSGKAMTYTGGEAAIKYA